MSRLNVLRTVLMMLGDAILAIVFQAYLKPGFIIDIANQFLLCL